MSKRKHYPQPSNKESSVSDPTNDRLDVTEAPEPTETPQTGEHDVHDNQAVSDEADQLPEATEAPVVTEPAATESPATEAPAPEVLNAKPATEVVVEEHATEEEAAAAAAAKGPAPVTQEAQSFDEYIAGLKENGTPMQKHVIFGMEDYASVMQVGRIVKEDKGIEAQKKFWRLLRDVLRNKEDYREGMALVVLYFKTHRKGFLSPDYTFRFADQLTMDKDHITAFQVVVNMFTNTALSNSISNALRQVDIGRALPHQIFSDLDRSRLAEFYQV